MPAGDGRLADMETKAATTETRRPSAKLRAAVVAIRCCDFSRGVVSSWFRASTDIFGFPAQEDEDSFGFSESRACHNPADWRKTALPYRIEPYRGRVSRYSNSRISTFRK